MKNDNPARHFILAFCIALVLYVVVYEGIEHRRQRNGPWEVRFAANSNGTPVILINHWKLGMTNIQICFPGASVPETNPLITTFSFAIPRAVPYDVPYGQCVFMDTTFLPGTITFSNIYGHMIELLPRVLVLDRVEHPWKANEEIDLVPVTVHQ